MLATETDPLVTKSPLGALCKIHLLDHVSSNGKTYLYLLRDKFADSENIFAVVILIVS